MASLAKFAASQGYTAESEFTHDVIDQLLIEWQDQHAGIKKEEFNHFGEKLVFYSYAADDSLNFSLYAKNRKQMTKIELGIRERAGTIKLTKYIREKKYQGEWMSTSRMERLDEHIVIRNHVYDIIQAYLIKHIK